MAQLCAMIFGIKMTNQTKLATVLGRIQGGGVQGSKDPPGPQRGGPGPLFQNEEKQQYYLQFYLIPPNKSL